MPHLYELEMQAKAARRGAWSKCSREILGNHRRQSQQSRLELGLISQRLIPTGEQSGLWTHIATTGRFAFGKLSPTQWRRITPIAQSILWPLARLGEGLPMARAMMLS
jgi:hypothetical protein